MLGIKETRRPNVFTEDLSALPSSTESTPVSSGLNHIIEDDLKHLLVSGLRFNDFLLVRSVFFLYKEADSDSRFYLAKATFMFDVVYSIVALDLTSDKDVVDANVLKRLNTWVESRLVSLPFLFHLVLIHSVGLLCFKQAPVLMTVSGGQSVYSSYMNMQDELKNVIVPDQSR